MKKGFLIPVFFVMIISVTNALPAKVYFSKEEALKRTFPSADSIDRQSIFLDEGDIKKIQELSRLKIETKLYSYYTARGKDKVLGYAFFGSHVIRTKDEVYMAVISPDGSIINIEILAFNEPEEFLPSRRWLDQFTGKILNDGLWPRRDIVTITGATLTSNGLTGEIRKILAVFRTMNIK